MSSEAPFKISVPSSQLASLISKLSSVTFPDELEAAEWDYGSPLTDIKRITKYWKDEYLPKWNEKEQNLNQELPQFTQTITVDGFGGLEVHYVHKKSEGSAVDAIPLLFLHGWPGSFLEVRKILPLLTSGNPSDHPTFNVVAPSLPNFGFSEGVKKRGFGLVHYAEAVHKLMVSLGYDEYVVQGGDWGAAIAQFVASAYGPKHVKAWHTNFPLASPPTLTANPIIYLQTLLSTTFSSNSPTSLRLAHTANFRNTGRAYFQLQATKPQTLSYSLADSPVGLLAWIYEKLVSWTDNYSWTDEEVCDWAMVYWFSRAGPGASVRIYYEALHAEQWEPEKKNEAPYGYSYFPKEIAQLPASWHATIGNLVFYNEHTRGGHFAATEQPQELVDDLRKMLGGRLKKNLDGKLIWS